MRLIPIALALLAAGCNREPLAGPDAGGGDLSATSPDLADGDLGFVCPLEELAFTRETGCQNDGSLEFCLPKDDAAALAEVRRIAPTVSCAAGGGRAMCDPMTQLLCFYPTGPDNCLAPHGALGDQGWRDVCALAALPQVTRIVPTFFE